MSILGLCNRENRPKYLHKGFQYGVLENCRFQRGNFYVGKGIIEVLYRQLKELFREFFIVDIRRLEGILFQEHVYRQVRIIRATAIMVCL